MRTTIYPAVAAILLMAMGPLFAYNIGDEVILKRFQSTCYKLNQHPSLWQVTHNSQNGSDTGIQYELLAEYSSYKKRPQLTIYQGPHVYKILITNQESGRELRLESLGPITPEEPAQEPPRSLSVYPLGTFDFGSRLAFSKNLASSLFSGMEENHFSGRLRIIEGHPLWSFESETLPWTVEMIRHVFFPFRITWKNNAEELIQWRFQPEVDYQAWGIVDAKLKEITYSKSSNHSSLQAPAYKTAWTFIQRFENMEDLKTWESKKRSSAHASSPLWNTDERQYILKAY